MGEKASFPILPLRSWTVLPRPHERNPQRWVHSPRPRLVHRPIHPRRLLRVHVHVREDRYDRLPRPDFRRSYIDAGVGPIPQFGVREGGVRVRQHPVDKRQAVAPLQPVRGPVRPGDAAGVFAKERRLDKCRSQGLVARHDSPVSIRVVNFHL